MVRLCVPGAQKFEDSSPHLLGMTVFLRFLGGKSYLFILKKHSYIME